MKKFIAILLTLSMLFSLCAISVSASDDAADLSYAVASDLHYAPHEEALEWYSEDPIFGYANRRAALENESTLIIDEFLKQCAEDDKIQFVLVPGDLTNDGKMFIDDHKVVAEKFRKFEATTGKQIYVIDGNHDVGITGEFCETGLAEFKQVYYEFGYKEALSVMEDNCSYTADLGDKYRLIALDSCDPDKSTEDGMNDEKVEWVIEQAKKAKEDGKYPILMMHHNLLDHLPMQRLLSHDFIIRNHTITAEKWANAGIKLVFTGHEHCSDATSYTSTKGNVISDFATTSLTMYPLQYRYIEMREDSIIYEAKTIDKIDTAALKAMVPDYTDEQLAEMNKGLNAFAKQFLKNGVEYRLERGFNDEQLGIKPGDIYYGVVRDVVDGLNDVLNMPLYGEGSAQELAREYGIEIPDSDYKDGWDVATELVSAHYAGSENYPLSSRDVKILLLMVSLVLRNEYSVLSDMEIMQMAEAIILAQGTGHFMDVIFDFLDMDLNSVTPIEYFAVALLSPLFISFATDDGVDDNNGAIDGYGNNDTTGNITSNLSTTFSEILKYLLNMVIYVLKALGYTGD